MSLPYEIFRKQEVEISRRRFIKLGTLATLAIMSPCPSFAARGNRLSPERSLSFYNIHTQESLSTVYWAKGRYVSEALADIDHILRDHRAEKTKPIDTRLLDLLYGIAMELEAGEPFHIISGYRSPKTNALLHRHGRGTAKHSLHMHGKAIDIQLPDCRLPLLRRVAMRLRGGGVGYYPHSNFVHVDVGRVRYWYG